MKLYENLTEKKMDNFLKTLGSSIEKEDLVEIMNDERDLHGDFIVIKGYKKKKVVTKEGNFSSMTHSFSVKSLRKIIASTDKKLNLTLITEPFIKKYIEAHNNGKPVTEVQITTEPKFIIITEN
jgi:hypothetical protein